MSTYTEGVLPLLTLVKTITAPAIAGKKTADCFTNKKRYYYYDDNLDAWLPENQPEQPEGKFSVQELSQEATFKQVAESFLGQTGAIETLSRLLKERGAVITLPAIESLIERQENGEDVDLQADGVANFFFVNNKDGSVSVVRAYRDGRHWHVYVYRLDLGYFWSAGHRFFFRNTVSL